MAEGYRDNLAEQFRNVRNAKLGGTEKELAKNLRDTAKGTDAYQSAEQEHRAEAKDTRYEKLVEENASLKDQLAVQKALLDQLRGLLNGEQEQHASHEAQEKKILEKQWRTIQKENDEVMEAIQGQLSRRMIEEMHEGELVLGGMEDAVTIQREKGSLNFVTSTIDTIDTADVGAIKVQIKIDQERVDVLKRVFSDLIAGKREVVKLPNGDTVAYIPTP